MGNKGHILQTALFAVITGGVLLGGSFIVPWKYVSWGKLSIQPADTITVTGTAKTQEKNQIAQFSAGINVVKDNKEPAITEVNQKINEVIAAVKTFGIPDADVKTQNLNVFQSEETYYEEGRQKSRPGQWRVSNTIEIKLRDVDRATELADLLTKSGANNIYGPNFMMEDTEDAETELIGEAVNNAKEKAEKMAAATGRKLGKTLSVQEGATSGIRPVPMFAREAGVGGGGLEPGSATVQKTVTVTFELR